MSGCKTFSITEQVDLNLDKTMDFIIFFLVNFLLMFGISIANRTLEITARKMSTDGLFSWNFFLNNQSNTCVFFAPYLVALILNLFLWILVEFLHPIEGFDICHFLYL